MKNNISKFITSVCEKNYALADQLLQQIISEKVKVKVKKMVKGEDDEKHSKSSKKDSEVKKKYKSCP